MRTRKLAALIAASLGTAAIGLPFSTAQAAPDVVRAAAPAADPRVDPQADTPGFDDNLSQPWQKRYEGVRQDALEQRLRTGGTGTAERLGKGTYGKVEETGADKIFVVLAEFGRETHSAYPDKVTDSTRQDGPLHNQIPKPDRTVDNSTQWQKDYSAQHYKDIYFNRMDSFYQKQSQGKFSIDGQVTEWVKVPFNQARYGRDYCGAVVCQSTWFLVRDALAYWTQGKLDAGWSMTRIQTYLKTFDKQDRYDYDEDGDFDEPDGYIDHFQVVHAGGDEADGDPVYGEDAIWSHRWYAEIQPSGETGPDTGALFGGVDVGQGGVSDPNGANVTVPDNPTGVWVGDYTIQPENGGLSVFAHEFAHDLGLPDLYDTNGGSNSVEHWSLMAQSRGTTKGDPGIGDRPQAFGAWEKFQLGWLDYDTARAGRTSNHVLKPGSRVSGDEANGLVVLLPDKEVETDLGEPCATCGTSYYYSDSGNDLDNSMTLAVEGGGPLTAQVRYDNEADYDYAFLEYSVDDGATFTSLPTSESDGAVGGEGGTFENGISGSTDGEWVELTADVPAAATDVRWSYTTDGAVAEPGFRVDEITLDGVTIGTAEDADAWDLDGFRTTTGTETQSNLNAYFVDNRQYVGQDALLDNVYNFGFTGKNADRVEFFSYQPGALISYWDTTYDDNNTSTHPGAGQILPVDAHPYFTHTPDGALARPKMLTYDSTFSLNRSKSVVLHKLGKKFTIRGSNAVPTFDDSQAYWYDSDEHPQPHVGPYQPGQYSVDVPDTGTTVTVVKQYANGNIKVRVGAN